MLSNNASRPALLLLAFLSADGLSAATCREQQLKVQPKWISTLEFNPSGDEILIADPKDAKLHSLSVATGEMREVQVGIPTASVTKIAGGFLVQSSKEGSILGPLKRKVATFNLAEARSELTVLYSNWVTKGSTFVGFGSVPLGSADLSRLGHDPARGFQLGFVRGEVSSQTGAFSNVRLLEPVEDNDLYLLGFPYFAANDLGLFYVRMVGEEASLVAVTEKGFSKLLAFPRDFRRIPKLQTKSVGPSSTRQRFAEIEQKRMAVGLFGQGSFLYLLTREPDPGGDGTQWLLFQIHPQESKPRGAVRLPTTANHLSVSVGVNEWYLFERGEVRGWGDQDIQTLVRVPVHWIASPANSPLNAMNPTVSGCNKAPRTD